MKTRKISVSTIFVILIIAIVPFAAAADFPATTPSGIPISELEQFIDIFVAEHIGTKTAGASIAVIKNGQIVFSRAYGHAIQGDVKARTSSVFEWGSATKLLVWTSVMQLVEQGKLNLNNDIREYLPDNFLKRIRHETPITMYNLMNHNAGWEDRIVDLFYSNPKTVPSLEESILAWIPNQIFQPGTIVAYSNFGTAIAGLIVERISGQPFHQYVRENIFNPLGMRDTAIHPLQTDNPSVAERREQIKGHVPGREKLIPSEVERVFIGMYPAGSVIGTAEDAIKFLAALMPAEGETSILFRDNKILNEMLSVTLSFRDGFPRFSHGFMEHYGAVRALGHGGNTVAFSALLTFAPEERFGLVVMTNQAGETAICFGLTRALFGEFAPPAFSGALPDAREFSGTFTMARRQKRGFANLITSLSIFPVKAIDENTLDIAGAKFIQISPYVFKNIGGGVAFMDLIDYLFFETKDGRVTRISLMYFDLLPVGIGRLIMVFGSAILFALCILYILAAIIITVIGAIRNKKKKTPSNIMKKMNIALYASMAAVTINNVLFAIRGLSFVPYASLQIHFIFNIAFAIFVPIWIYFMWINRKKEPAKASMVFNYFTMASSVICAVILMAWGFWH
ncbi:MAG: beta-lactamase family protein [Spirochaetaceae bacterium]|nr:beta-lactamase family protein [Spirochaetaceae bacterium]